MKTVKSLKIEVSRLFEEERLKVILHVLEVDWPAAMAIIPAAMKAVDDGEKTPDCVEVFSSALLSYQRSFGGSDRERLKAFVTPLIDGVTKLLLADPPEKNRSIIDIQAVIAEGMGPQRYAAARKSVINQLLPPDTSIGRVWRHMQRS